MSDPADGAEDAGGGGLRRWGLDGMGDDVSARLRALPVRQQVAIVLHCHDGSSPAETAEILGCSVRTVRSLIDRAQGVIDVQALRAYADRAPGPIPELAWAARRQAERIRRARRMWLMITLTILVAAGALVVSSGIGR